MYYVIVFQTLYWKWGPRQNCFIWLGQSSLVLEIRGHMRGSCFIGYTVHTTLGKSPKGFEMTFYKYTLIPSGTEDPFMPACACQYAEVTNFTWLLGYSDGLFLSLNGQWQTSLICCKHSNVYFCKYSTKLKPAPYLQTNL